MEDKVLSSMCVRPVSYYTFAEQREAFTRESHQREISRDGNTYICMIVPILGRHWVAVRITITPFFLKQFPGQIFFSSQLRYGPCCCEIDHGDTWEIVRDTVQKVIDSSYRSVCWNYSSTQYCTLDPPTNTDIEQCIPVAKSKFQAYTKSHIEAHPSLGQTNSTKNQNALDGKSCPTSHALSSSVSLKRKVGTGPTKELITAPPPKKQRIREVEKDARLVQSTTLWLKDGLKNLSVERFPTLVNLSDMMPYQPKDGACALADHLWELADEVESASAAVVWSMRYIAACSSLVGTVFTSSSKRIMDPEFVEASRQSIYNWQGLVQIVNSIVNIMLLRWKNKAYLLYHVFAVKGCLLSDAARMSKARRESFASGVANALELTAPSGFEGVPLFDPTRVLSSMLPTKSHEEICKAIWLPSAINSGTIEGGRSILLIPNMATLSRRVKDLSVLPAQVKSGNILSTLDLSPPPTPPTFQQADSAETGESTESCNIDKANKYPRGVHFTQSSTTTTNISANLAQVGDWRPSHPTCGIASLAQVDAAGTMLPENSILSTNLHESTIASPVLNLDSEYGFDGSAFENSEFFRPLLNISDGLLTAENRVDLNTDGGLNS